MAGLYITLLFVHLTANIVWIGSILAVATILTSTDGDAPLRGRIALDVYKKLPVPAFVASFVTGLLRLLATPNYYFVETKFMHGKLLLVAIVIAVHHIIGARAKRLAAGKTDQTSSVGTLAAVLLLSATGAVFLVLMKPF
jgi:putative membrane protein